MGMTDIIFGRESRKATIGYDGSPLVGTAVHLGTISFDAMVSETHIDEAEVTDHPVEDGATVADHVRKKPVTLEINGMITNTPITWLASLAAESPLAYMLPGGDRVSDAYEELQRIMDEGQLVTVTTTLRTYENMVITSMTAPRDASKGNTLDVTLTLREIVKVSTLLVALPTPVKKASKGVKSKGKKLKKGATDKQGEKSQSVLSSILGSLRGGGL